MDLERHATAYKRSTYGNAASYLSRSRTQADTPDVCWAHTLCKNIELHFDETGSPYIRDPRGSRHNHGDWTWLRSGYFLKWKNPGADGLKNSEVTLIIFSATPDLKEHLQQLVSRQDWRQAVMDPFILLVIVAENLFLEISTTINKVLCVLRHTENLVLGSASGESPEGEFDFVGLHNISKHTIYLKESSNAAVALAKRFCDGHESIMRKITCPERLELMESVHELLLHKCTSLEGLVLRVAGMENLVQNLINLAFNIVNQRDSNALKGDSQAMKIIAILTMILLPSTALATIFGSSFFNFNVASQKVVVAKNFGVFWMTAIPLTLAVVSLSAAWYSIASMLEKIKRHAVRLYSLGKLELSMKSVEVSEVVNGTLRYIVLLFRLMSRRESIGGTLDSWMQSRRAQTNVPMSV
ncbi:MAG: hypothetical protein Q9179_007314 [Wetmoreana sp. 5 TL-2023]